MDLMPIFRGFIIKVHKKIELLIKKVVMEGAKKVF